MRMKKIGFILLLALLALLLTACGDDFQFEGRALAPGKVGEAYQDSIAIDKKNMYYEEDYTAVLPRGMYLTEEGLLTGTPEESGFFSFTLVAVDEKDNYKEAVFTIEIEKGTLTYVAKDLAEASQGEPYVQNLATASGMPKISYALKEGSQLPAGLELSAKGELSGIPEEAAEEVTFIVVASAGGCDPVEARYTLKINASAAPVLPTDLGYIVFEGIELPDGLVGQEYSESIRLAYGVPDITYKVKYIGGVGFPKGLKLNDAGMIAGTPSNSTSGILRFNVVASAEGCKSVTAEFSLRVYDVYEATNRMEAEHIDVDKLKGAGYSGSAGGLAMLQSYPNASGGKALGYLNTAATFQFVIEAKETTSAKLILCLATEWGNLTLTPNTFKIFVNEQELDYGSFDIKEDGYGSSLGFQEITLMPDIQLAAGENVIRYQIIDSEDTEGVGTATAKGPIFDYMQIDGASCEIGWRPRVANTK